MCTTDGEDACSAAEAAVRPCGSPGWPCMACSASLWPIRLHRIVLTGFLDRLITRAIQQAARESGVQPPLLRRGLSCRGKALHRLRKHTETRDHGCKRFRRTLASAAAAAACPSHRCSLCQCRQCHANGASRASLPAAGSAAGAGAGGHLCQVRPPLTVSSSRARSSTSGCEHASPRTCLPFSHVIPLCPVLPQRGGAAAGVPRLPRPAGGSQRRGVAQPGVPCRHQHAAWRAACMRLPGLAGGARIPAAHAARERQKAGKCARLCSMVLVCITRVAGPHLTTRCSLPPCHHIGLSCSWICGTTGTPLSPMMA